METAFFIGPKFWDTLLNGCKDAILLKSFKENLKFLKTIPADYAKLMIHRVGFL